MKRIKTNSIGARVLSGVLSVLMIMSACPTTAFAEYDEPEDKTIVVENSDTETENKDAVVVVDSSTDEDENVDSIPVDEDADDQTTPDVDVPPNITTEATEVTTTEVTTENTTEKATEAATEAEKFDYSVKLQKDATVNVGDEFTVNADVKATVTANKKTSDVDYTFEYSVSDSKNVTIKSDNTSATFVFNKEGNYTIEGKMIVDGKTVASDKMKVTAEKELPIVEFDHYFTDIDESLIETSDLIVTTNDASIFTKNTNVVSNFDNAYIISCDSVEQARYVYSYYVDKVDTITDLSKVISVATEDNDEDVANMSDINNSNDALSNLNDIDVNNYAGYIALIDTGANADVNFSVVGDDTSDSNGHGTKMLNLIKTENPDAKVMSIKVFNGSKTDAASVYAGIKLAIESKVSVINLSLVGSNVEKNAIVKDAINEAIANGITVIGAAGNYNISAKKFIPGCIDDVIVIGAANEDGTKYATSNTNADYYVVAESTSEATAIYTGLYTASKLDDNRIFNDIDKNESIDINNPDNENTWYINFAKRYGYDYIVNEDGSISFIIPIENDFETSSPGRRYHNTTNITSRYKYDNLSSIADGTYYSSGRCSFTASEPGDGTISGFSGDGVFEHAWKNAGSPAIYASCDSHWEDTSKSHYALPLSNDSPYYNATSIVKTSSDKKYKLLDVDLKISDDGIYEVEWNPESHTYNIFGNYNTSTNNGKDFTISGHYNVIEDGVLIKTESLNNISVSASSNNDALDKARDKMQAQLEAKLQSYISKYKVSDYCGFRNSTNSTFNTSDRSTPNQLSYKLIVNFERANHTQIYRAIFDAYSYNNIKIKLHKTVSNYDKYKELLNSTDYYSLNGSTFEVRDASDGNKMVKDTSGNDVTWTIKTDTNSKCTSPEFELDFSKYKGHKLYMQETKAGKGYKYNSTKVYQTLPTVGGGDPTVFNFTNIPIGDPMRWNIVKISDMNGKSGEHWSGDIKPIHATYTVKQYFLNDDHSKGRLENTWTYQTDENGRVRFSNPAYIKKGSKEPPKDPTDNTKYVWPIGYYEITETAVSVVGEKPAGTKKNNTVYTFIQYQNTNTSVVSSQVLKEGNTKIMEKVDDNPIHINPDYQIIVKDDNGNTKPITGASLDKSEFYTVESEVWMYLGLFKADSGLVYSGYKDKDAIIAKPQGDATFAGAKYQVFVESPDKNNFFKSASGANNGKVLSFGSDVTSVDQEDGLGNKTTVTLANKLTPVLVDGKPLYITVGSDGVGRTSVKLPMSSKYRAVEVSAPKGYRASDKVEKFEGQWVTDKATGRDYLDLNTPVGDKKITAPVKNSKRTGMTTEMLYYYGIRGIKKDTYNEVGQGNGTTNGIRYAVINKSDNAIALNTPHTTVDLDYCNWTANKLIANGQIVAILTTHTVNNVEGTFRMNGLPYGKYQVVELRKDAKFVVGDVYSATSSKAGTSKLSNDAYLYAENKSPVFELHDATNGYTLRLNTLSVSNEDQYVIKNEPFVDGFRAYKMDKTNLDKTEGFSSANDIKFAIVNKSNRQVRLEKKYVDQLGEDAAFVDYKAHEVIAPGEVVAILTTHDKNTIDGYMSIYGLPFGMYEVHELRRDATIQVGDAYAGSNKLGSDIFANDSYYYKDPAQPLNFTDTVGTGHHACTLNASFAAHNFKHNDKNSSFQDEVFRDGFSFWKRDFTFNKLDNHPQGDATFNGIRYAVVNRSDKVVRLFNEYNLVDPNYVTIVDGKDIENGQVAAILTSHQKDKLEGYVAMYGLPYGKYDIYELAADATIAVGDAYDSSNKLGKSIYASAYPEVNTVKNAKKNPSMLFEDSLQQTVLFTYTLTDTTNELKKKYDISHIHDADDTGKQICTDETVYGTLKITKYDAETGQTGADGNQGINTFAGIKYAVVNRSKNSVSYPYESSKKDDIYEPGQIITIVELDKTGTATLEHMCFGTYDIYELRMDSTLAAHDTYDTATAKYGKDHKANAYYTYCDDIKRVDIVNRDLKVIDVDYTVDPALNKTLRTQDFEIVDDVNNLPVRADFNTIKVDIDGKRMAHIPFLISLVETDKSGNPVKKADGTYKVLEEHIMVTDSRGELNTRDFVSRPKKASNVNKLDGLYSGVDFTGTKEQLLAAATQNIWFGTVDEYIDTNTYLTDKRGSLLTGTYILQELRLNPEYGFDGQDANGKDWSTMPYDMISSKIIVTEDNVVVDPSDFDIGVNIPIYIKSVALDSKSKSNSFVPDKETELQDTIEFDNLNSSQAYGFKSAIYRVKADGSNELLYEDDSVIPVSFDELLKLTDGKLNGAKLAYDDATGKWTLLTTKAEADPVFNVVHDFQIQRNVTIDTSMCQEGEYIAFTVDLYKSLGANGWKFLKHHNETLTEATQKLGVISINTKSVNKTTDTRIGSLGGYTYTDGNKELPLTNTNSLVYNKDGEIIGYTLVDDKVEYKNLADNHNYRMRVELVDDNNNIVTDIYGNSCVSSVLGLYSSNEVSTMKEVVAVDDRGEVIEKHFDVPCNGSFNFSDIGVMDWVIPNNTTVHVKVILMDGRGEVLKIHNAKFTEEDENVRYINIKTTAMSEEGTQGVLPNGKSWDENGKVVYKDSTLIDKIDYTNCAEATTIRVDGYVYLVEYAEDGTRSIAKDTNGNPIVVATNSEKFNVHAGSDSLEMKYTVKFGELAARGIDLSGKDLVVCERAYMEVNHRYVKNANGSLTRETGNFEVLVALHENINDKMQTVSIPDIHTNAVNAHNGSKTISNVYADVTVNDKVTYTNLKPGIPWNLTAILYNKETGEPVLDAYGNIAQNTIEFTPESKNGEVIVPITFKQVLNGTDWEDDPSWVCFESLREGTKGHSELEYAVHNNLHDNDQTVHRPTFRTYAQSESTTEPKFINAAIGQVVTDKVEVKNIGLNAIKDEDGNITGYEPQKFTLKIEAVDAETGEYILDSKGKVVSNTKTFTLDGTKGKTVYHEHADKDIECNVVKFNYVENEALQIPIVIDATNLANKTIVFYETLYYGDECKDGEEVLIENYKENVDQQVQVLDTPEIGTKLVDRLTDDVTVAYGQTVELVDTVTYKNLLTGVSYRMDGVLMDKTTGKPVVDKDGNEVTGSAVFTPKETDPREGTVDVVFTVDTTGLEGHTLVAFETCYEIGSETTIVDDRFIAEHKDLTDVNQTVYVLKIGTSATDKVDGDKALDGTKNTQTIVDTINYKNLVVGKEYTIKTKLALADTNPVEYVKDKDGKVVTVTEKFTPEAPEDNPDAKTVTGSVDVEITFDASQYAGRKVVVFEDVYYKGVKIATHSDIKDKNQSVDISLLLHVQAAKVDAQNETHFLEGAEITIYTDKECTKIAKDVNGKDCVGVTNKEGLVDFTILTYDVNSVLYAKETKAPFGFKINEDTFEVHPSLDRTADEATGTCLISMKIADFAIVIPPKTGDNLPVLPIVIFSLIGIICIAAFFALKPKKTNSETSVETANTVDTVDNEENADNSNTNVEEDIADNEDSVVALMDEDIDGSPDDSPDNTSDTNV